MKLTNYQQRVQNKLKEHRESKRILRKHYPTISMDIFKYKPVYARYKYVKLSVLAKRLLKNNNIQYSTRIITNKNTHNISCNTSIDGSMVLEFKINDRPYTMLPVYNVSTKSWMLSIFFMSLDKYVAPNNDFRQVPVLKNDHVFYKTLHDDEPLLNYDFSTEHTEEEIFQHSTMHDISTLQKLYNISTSIKSKKPTLNNIVNSIKKEL